MNNERQFEIQNLAVELEDNIQLKEKSLKGLVEAVYSKKDNVDSGYCHHNNEDEYDDKILEQVFILVLGETGEQDIRTKMWE